MRFKAEISKIYPRHFIYKVVDRHANEVIHNVYGRELDFKRMFSEQTVLVEYENFTPYTEFGVDIYSKTINDPYEQGWMRDWLNGKTEYIHPTVVFSDLVDKMYIVKGIYRIFLAEGLKDDNYVY